jgi:hypothetical protein
MKILIIQFRDKTAVRLAWLQAEAHRSYKELWEIREILRNAYFEGVNIFTRWHFIAFQEVWCYYILLIITSVIKAEVWEDKVEKKLQITLLI